MEENKEPENAAEWISRMNLEHDEFLLMMADPYGGKELSDEDKQKLLAAEQADCLRPVRGCAFAILLTVVAFALLMALLCGASYIIDWMHSPN